MTLDDDTSHAGVAMHVAHRRRQLGLCALIATTLWIAACAQEPVERSPNVVIIVLDTLRADHLGCYGYARPTSPAIDAFAARATRYRNCVAAAPWTLPSHASLFTGKFPREHGLRTYVDKDFRETLYPLADEHLTLAEALGQEGYRNIGYYANGAYLDPRYNLQQGFDAWEFKKGWAPAVNAAAFDFLARAGDQPFFLFLNYLDTHRVYNTTPRPGVTETPAVRDQGEMLDRLIAAVMPGLAPATPSLVQAVVDQYDTAIANVDVAIGELLAEIERRGLYDDTVIVLTSDHGEFLGEHLLAGHGKDVYSEVTFVPLIVKGRGQRESRLESALAATVDVARLVMLEMPESISARWLPHFPHAPGSGLVVSEHEWARPKDLLNPHWGHRFKRLRTAYFEWPWKLIDSSDGANELYDLSTDPHETTNVIAPESERAARMQKALADAQAASDKTAWRPGPDSKPAGSDVAHDKALRDLGYAGDDH